MIPNFELPEFNDKCVDISEEDFEQVLLDPNAVVVEKSFGNYLCYTTALFVFVDRTFSKLAKVIVREISNGQTDYWVQA